MLAFDDELALTDMPGAEPRLSRVQEEGARLDEEAWLGRGFLLGDALSLVDDKAEVTCDMDTELAFANDEEDDVDDEAVM